MKFKQNEKLEEEFKDKKEFKTQINNIIIDLKDILEDLKDK